MPRLRLSVLTAASLAVFATAHAARADLPPPSGQKFVGYSFKVANVDAYAKDYALLAYPCGTSSGAPIAEMAELQPDAAVPVGRRGGDCPLYVMARADFEAWKKLEDRSESTLDALFKSTKVRRCSGGPNIRHELPTSDSRDGITETLTISKLDAKECVIAAADVQRPPPAQGSATPANASPTDASKSDPPPAVSPGCSRCTVGEAPMGAGGLAALGLVGMFIFRTGTRRARRPKS